MKVLVTGATGFVGRHLVPLLLDADHDVVVFVRDAARYDGPPGVEVVEGDIFEPATLDPAMAGVDAAYYLIHVIGTASGSNEEYLRELGVDEFVNYREQRFEEVLEPVDGVIDGVGGETFDRSLEILNEGGTIDKLPSPPTDEQQELADEQGVEAIMTTVRWNGEWFEDITELLADGTVSVTLDTVLPLSEATEAHRLSEAKHARGKIILTPGDDESASN